ncbi:MAG: GDSL-type esterase/lipase family protein [Prevotellaceae bacterium]|jgi:hypothetical protein|nr:GDSL-type esterase/lipase family protein [Prevotellaceae bacterium]
MIYLKNYTYLIWGLNAVLAVCIISKCLSAKDVSADEHVSLKIDTIAYTPSINKISKKTAPNEIADNLNRLNPFFDKLTGLKTQDTGTNTVSIVHLGDSHIQADFLTQTVRRLMHRHFGNPGRGLVAPNRLMRSNNGRNYRINSEDKWKHSFVVKPNGIPIGIAGLGLQIADTAASVNLLTFDESESGEWDFNRITTYCDLANADINIEKANVVQSTEQSVYAKTFTLDSLTNDIDIQFYSSPDKREINLFGFNLSNSQSGIFYHSIGVNGAKYCDFCNKDVFFHQLPTLSPELVIISFGTNEAMAKVVDETSLYSNISSLVADINSRLPNAVIMLTTPAETYTRNRAAPNPRTGKVRDIIVDYAETNGLPYWDLYAITGGKGSAVNWNKKRMMTRDRIHLTQYGYEYQGTLLFEAIAKSYNKYLKQKYGI